VWELKGKEIDTTVEPHLMLAPVMMATLPDRLVFFVRGTGVESWDLRKMIQIPALLGGISSDLNKGSHVEVRS
jgi:hypothetical protein